MTELRDKGRELGVTTERARQIEARALGRLRSSLYRHRSALTGLPWDAVAAGAEGD